MTITYSLLTMTHEKHISHFLGKDHKIGRVSSKTNGPMVYISKTSIKHNSKIPCAIIYFNDNGK